jgi:hypothetical protein
MTYEIYECECKNLADLLNFNKDKIPRARRIFKNLCEVEKLLQTGITIKVLVDELNKNGFEIGFRVFEVELYRARKKQRQKVTGYFKTKSVIDINITAPISSSETKQTSNLSHEKNIDIPVNKTALGIKESSRLNEELAKQFENKPTALSFNKNKETK